MSLKAVELQVALPRTVDVGRIQEQQLNRMIHQQQSMLDERKELDEHMRQRPLNVDETMKNQIREREQKQKQQRNQHGEEGASFEEKEAAASPSNTASPVAMRDPMRGRLIDISL